MCRHCTPARLSPDRATVSRERLTKASQSPFLKKANLLSLAWPRPPPKPACFQMAFQQVCLKARLGKSAEAIQERLWGKIRCRERPALLTAIPQKQTRPKPVCFHTKHFHLLLYISFPKCIFPFRPPAKRHLAFPRARERERERKRTPSRCFFFRGKGTKFKHRAGVKVCPEV